MDDRLTQRTAGQNQSRREKLLWNDRVEGSALPSTHTQQQHGNIETCLMLNKKLPPMPKGRGAEQGDVDGPLECTPWR